ncbi:Hypothetical protein AA314_04829 [Archangium gephyra]|uniref:Uncharacterized protein n=1 Tax=Archangium gephyra TaxID=48 RepID=A0AAC8Q9S2_9BACT|nr:Hypothetical protein AA314_04829 [Archangium gephyra]
MEEGTHGGRAISTIPPAGSPLVRAAMRWLPGGEGGGIHEPVLMGLVLGPGCG